MVKKLMIYVLCLAVLLTLPLNAYAEEAEPEKAPAMLRISSTEQFLRFAENCRLDSYSRNLQVTLTADLDLTGIAFEGIPLFCGSFDGGGHTISGLSISCEGSNLGLFRYLTKTAVVSNLKVSGDIHPQGSQGTVGGIAGSNAGTIQNCEFTGTVSGADYVGGLVGSNSVTGVIDSCEMHGSLHGNHFVGGIAGSNIGVIRDCANHALVNTTAQQNSVEISDITLDSMMGSEAVNTVTDIGGIAGISSGVIRGCENRGDVGYLSMGYNVGGIAGSQMGYITDCVNYSSIRGRKEVGGITGQMEPVTNIQYTQDTLQILQGQLNTMTTLANQASSHAQEGVSDASWQISNLQDNISNAQYAIEELLWNSEGGFPDTDSIIAAENAINSSLYGIESSLSGIASSVYSTANSLSSDMRAISNQIGAMQETINSASENLGGTVTDISDLDTPEDVVGKVSHCDNFGSVSADRNAGGIAGAMTLENDLDLDEDLQFSGEESLNFDSELRAVILSCTNSAAVTAGKQNAGGIVGWMPMGLVKDSLNTGTLDALSADYVGGIAGQSSGFIRSCYSKCQIEGESFVGGIAGLADTVTNCRSMVMLTATERSGAIIGYTDNPMGSQSTEQPQEETEGQAAVFDNLYTPIHTDPGAIDGISYDQAAQPVSMSAFVTLDLIPQELTFFSVQFRFADDTTQSLQIIPGEVLKAEDIPSIPGKSGYTAHWDGLDSMDIDFDKVFTASYTPLPSVLASEESRNGKPVLLVEGAFLPDAAISLSGDSSLPPLEEGQTVLCVSSISLPTSTKPVTVRCLLPEGTDPDQLQALIQTHNDIWEPVTFRTDGSYMVFTAYSGSMKLALVDNPVTLPLWIPACACAALLLLLLSLAQKKRKKKASARTPENSADATQ